MKISLLIKLGLGILLLLSACGKEEPKAPQLPLDVPDQVIENTTITFTEQGVKSAVIYAKHLEVYEKKDLRNQRSPGRFL